MTQHLLESTPLHSSLVYRYRLAFLTSHSCSTHKIWFYSILAPAEACKVPPCFWIQSLLRLYHLSNIHPLTHFLNTLSLDFWDTPYGLSSLSVSSMEFGSLSIYFISLLPHIILKFPQFKGHPLRKPLCYRRQVGVPIPAHWERSLRWFKGLDSCPRSWSGSTEPSPSSLWQTGF